MTMTVTVTVMVTATVTVMRDYGYGNGIALFSWLTTSLFTAQLILELPNSRYYQILYPCFALYRLSIFSLLSLFANKLLPTIIFPFTCILSRWKLEKHRDAIDSVKMETLDTKVAVKLR